MSSKRSSCLSSSAWAQHREAGETAEQHAMPPNMCDRQPSFRHDAVNSPGQLTTCPRCAPAVDPLHCTTHTRAQRLPRGQKKVLQAPVYTMKKTDVAGWSSSLPQQPHAQRCSGGTQAMMGTAVTHQSPARRTTAWLDGRSIGRSPTRLETPCSWTGLGGLTTDKTAAPC